MPKQTVSVKHVRSKKVIERIAKVLTANTEFSYGIAQWPKDWSPLERKYFRNQAKEIVNVILKGC